MIAPMAIREFSRSTGYLGCRQPDDQGTQPLEDQRRNLWARSADPDAHFKDVENSKSSEFEDVPSSDATAYEFGQNATAPDDGIRTSRSILESFTGFVDEIRGETAYLTLTSRDGEELMGEYPAKKLEEMGIREGRRFLCMTVQANGAVQVEFEAIPDRELSAAEEQAIAQEIEASLGDADLDGDN